MRFAFTVNQKMCNEVFWKRLCSNNDKILLSYKQITQLNQSITSEKETKTYDLEKIDGNFRYSVCIKRANIKQEPTKKINGLYDSNQLTSLNVNEPFVIVKEKTINNQVYYWGYCQNYTGWVSAESMAICKNKQEWLNSWKVDSNKKNFLVITQDKIITEQSLYSPGISNIQLMMGTTLRLVPDRLLPDSIDNRCLWNNYAVYLPTRDKNGNYKKSIVLISQHYHVSIGYLPLTESSILQLAFSCLGNRYGWGGMLGSMDCSMFTRSIYKCFGLELPRNASEQKKIPNYVTDISNLSNSKKQKYISSLHAGALLYFPGHTMVYIGTYNKINYVISAVGSLCDSAKSSNYMSANSIVITPLTVKRKDGTTWIKNIDKVVSFI